MSDFILRKGPLRVGILASLIHFLNGLGQDEEWQVTVKRHKKSRSDTQNAALWGVAYATLERETGNEAEDLHQYFCGEFFGWSESVVMGRRKVKPRRTTTRDEAGKRDVVEWDVFCDFYATIQRRAAAIGVYVPDPDPNWKDAA